MLPKKILHSTRLALYAALAAIAAAAVPAAADDSERRQLHREVVSRVLPAERFRQDLVTVRRMAVIDFSNAARADLADVIVRAALEAAPQDTAALATQIAAEAAQDFADAEALHRALSDQRCASAACVPFDCSAPATLDEAGKRFCTEPIPDVRIDRAAIELAKLLDLALPVVAAEVARVSEADLASCGTDVGTDATSACATEKVRERIETALSLYQQLIQRADLHAEIGAQIALALEDGRNLPELFGLPAIALPQRTAEILAFLRLRCNFRDATGENREECAAVVDGEPLGLAAVLADVDAWAQPWEAWLGLRDGTSAGPTALLRAILPAGEPLVSVDEIEGAVWRWNAWTGTIALACLDRLTLPDSLAAGLSGDDRNTRRRKLADFAAQIRANIDECHDALVLAAPPFAAALRLVDKPGEERDSLERRADLVMLVGDAVGLLSPPEYHEKAAAAGARETGISLSFRFDPLRGTPRTFNTGVAVRPEAVGGMLRAIGEAAPDGDLRILALAHAAVATSRDDLNDLAEAIWRGETTLRVPVNLPGRAPAEIVIDLACMSSAATVAAGLACGDGLEAQLAELRDTLEGEMEAAVAALGTVNAPGLPGLALTPADLPCDFSLGPNVGALGVVCTAQARIAGLSPTWEVKLVVRPLRDRFDVKLRANQPRGALLAVVRDLARAAGDDLGDLSGLAPELMPQVAEALGQVAVKDLCMDALALDAAADALTHLPGAGAAAEQCVGAVPLPDGRGSLHATLVLVLDRTYEARVSLGVTAEGALSLRVHPDDLEALRTGLVSTLSARLFDMTPHLHRTLALPLAPLGDVRVEVEPAPPGDPAGLDATVVVTPRGAAAGAAPYCIGPIRVETPTGDLREFGLDAVDLSAARVGRLRAGDTPVCEDATADLVATLLDLPAGAWTVAAEGRALTLRRDDEAVLRLRVPADAPVALEVASWPQVASLMRGRLEGAMFDGGPVSVRLEPACGFAEACEGQADDAEREIEAKITLTLAPDAIGPLDLAGAICATTTVSTTLPADILTWDTALSAPEPDEATLGRPDGEKCVEDPQIGDRIAAALAGTLTAPSALDWPVMATMRFASGWVACGTPGHCLILNAFLGESRPERRLAGVVVAPGRPPALRPGPGALALDDIAGRMLDGAGLRDVAERLGVDVDVTIADGTARLTVADLDLLGQPLCVSASATWPRIAEPPEPGRVRLEITEPGGTCREATPADLQAMVEPLLARFGFDRLQAGPITPTLEDGPAVRFTGSVELPEAGTVPLDVLVRLDGTIEARDSISALSQALARAAVLRLADAAATLAGDTAPEFTAEVADEGAGRWHARVTGDIDAVGPVCLSAVVTVADGRATFEDGRFAVGREPASETPGCRDAPEAVLTAILEAALGELPGDPLVELTPQDGGGVRLTARAQIRGTSVPFTLVLDASGARLALEDTIAALFEAAAGETDLFGMTLEATATDLGDMRHRVDLSLGDADGEVIAVRGLVVTFDTDALAAGGFPLALDRKGASVRVDEDRLAALWRPRLAELGFDDGKVTFSGPTVTTQDGTILVKIGVAANVDAGFAGTIGGTLTVAVRFDDGLSIRVERVEPDVGRLAVEAAIAAVSSLLQDAGGSVDAYFDGDAMVVTWATGEPAEPGFCLRGIKVPQGATRWADLDVDFTRFAISRWRPSTKDCPQSPQAVGAFFGTLLDRDEAAGGLRIGEQEIRSADGIFYALALDPADDDALSSIDVIVAYAGLTREGLALRADPANSANAAASQLAARAIGKAVSGVVSVVQSALVDLPGVSVRLIETLEDPGNAGAPCPRPEPRKECIFVAVNLPFGAFPPAPVEGPIVEVEIPYEVTFELPALEPIDLVSHISLSDKGSTVHPPDKTKLAEKLVGAFTTLFGDMVKVTNLSDPKFDADGLDATFDIEVDLASWFEGLSAGAQGLRVRGTRVDLPDAVKFTFPSELHVAAGVTLTKVGGWLPLAPGGRLGVTADWIPFTGTGGVLRMPLQVSALLTGPRKELSASGRLIALSILELYEVDGIIAIEEGDEGLDWLVDMRAGTAEVLRRFLRQDARLYYARDRFLVSSDIAVFSVELAKTKVRIDHAGFGAEALISALGFITTAVEFVSNDHQFDDVSFAASFKAEVVGRTLAGASFDASRPCGALVVGSVGPFEIAAHGARPADLPGRLPGAVVRAAKAMLDRLVGKKPKFDKGPCDVLKDAAGGVSAAENRPIGLGDPIKPIEELADPVVSATDAAREANGPVDRPGGGSGPPDGIPVPDDERIKVTPDPACGNVFVGEAGVNANRVCLVELQRGPVCNSDSGDNFGRFASYCVKDLKSDNAGDSVQYDLGRMYRFCWRRNGGVDCDTPPTEAEQDEPVGHFLASEGGRMVVGQAAATMLSNPDRIFTLLHVFGTTVEGRTDTRTQFRALPTCTSCHTGSGQTLRVRSPRLGSFGAEETTDEEWRSLLLVQEATERADRTPFIVDGAAVTHPEERGAERFDPGALPTSVPRLTTPQNWAAFAEKHTIAAGCDDGESCALNLADAFLLEPFAVSETNAHNDTLFAALAAKAEKTRDFTSFFSLPGGKRIDASRLDMEAIIPIAPMKADDGTVEVNGGYIFPTLVVDDNGNTTPELRVVSRRIENAELAVKVVPEDSVYSQYLDPNAGGRADHRIGRTLLAAIEGGVMPAVLACDTDEQTALLRRNSTYYHAGPDRLVTVVSYSDYDQTAAREGAPSSVCPGPIIDPRDKVVAAALEAFVSLPQFSGLGNIVYTMTENTRLDDPRASTSLLFVPDPTLPGQDGLPPVYVEAWDVPGDADSSTWIIDVTCTKFDSELGDTPLPQWLERASRAPALDGLAENLPFCATEDPR